VDHRFHKCNETDCSICRGGLAYCDVCKRGESELEGECPGVAVPGSHRTRMTSQDVAASFDGKVEVELHLPTNMKEIQKGYYAMRKMTLWAHRKSGLPVPEHVQYTLRWLRENFAFKKDRKGGRV
jgi:hypothetical protein